MTHLSERALVHVEAGLGDTADRGHLESCLVCARRLQTLGRDLALVTRTLTDTTEPRLRPAPVFRRWVPAAAAAMGMALAALLWVEVAVWRAVTYVPPSMQPEEARAMLAQVSASLFSLGGDPPAAEAAVPEPLGALLTGDGDEQEGECAGSEWLVRSACGVGGAS
jgi:hypothetical protein